MDEQHTQEDQHNQQNQQSAPVEQQTNPDDPSSLIPKITMGRGVKIGAGVVVLVGALALLHFSMKSSLPTETTKETPNGSVVTITPPPDGTPVMVPEIVKDKDGKEYLTGELIVAFRASVPVDEAKKMVVSAGGVVKQHFTQFPVFLVGIPEKGSEGVNKAILKFKTLPEVERAEPNYLTQAPTP